MFSMRPTKGQRFFIVVIAVLTPLVIIAIIHLLDREEKSVYDNVLTEQIDTDIA